MANRSRSRTAGRSSVPQGAEREPYSSGAEVPCSCYSFVRFTFSRIRRRGWERPRGPEMKWGLIADGSRPACAWWPCIVLLLPLAAQTREAAEQQSGTAGQEETEKRQEPARESPPELTEEVVVVGTRAQPRTVTESVVPIDVISSKDIVNQGEPDVADQLRKRPSGLQRQSATGGGCGPHHPPGHPPGPGSRSHAGPGQRKEAPPRRRHHLAGERGRRRRPTDPTFP